MRDLREQIVMLSEEIANLRRQLAEKELEDAKAVKAAVAAIYFNDNSDYETALWQVVTALQPDLVEMLQNGRERSAFLQATEAFEHLTDKYQKA